MGWTECIASAIRYIEDNITQELTVEKIARQAMVSPFYFQKGFAMLCGFTVGEYIRKRRLTLAGGELVSTEQKTIDIALKYGYESPDSFTKAFVRFHGATPAAVRRGEAMVKAFAELKIKLILTGGYTMDYKIVNRDAFYVIGMRRMFDYEKADAEVPKFWNEYQATGKCALVTSVYGVSIDENMKGDRFEYWIADRMEPGREIPAGFETREIPKHTWAVFACRGMLAGVDASSLPEVHRRIFSEWLPNSKEYELAAGYHIEMYANPADYAHGVQDEAYYSEIWIPVRKKAS